MSVITIITEAFPTCLTCDLPPDIFILSAATGEIEATCFTCHVVTIITAQQALDAAMAAEREQTTDGTGPGQQDGHNVRRHRVNRHPVDDSNGGRTESVSPVGRHTEDAPLPDDGADDTVEPERIRTRDSVGTG